MPPKQLSPAIKDLISRGLGIPCDNISGLDEAQLSDVIRRARIRNGLTPETHFSVQGIGIYVGRVIFPDSKETPIEDQIRHPEKYAGITDYIYEPEKH